MDDAGGCHRRFHPINMNLRPEVPNTRLPIAQANNPASSDLLIGLMPPYPLPSYDQQALSFAMDTYPTTTSNMIDIRPGRRYVLENVKAQSRLDLSGSDQRSSTLPIDILNASS